MDTTRTAYTKSTTNTVCIVSTLPHHFYTSSLLHHSMASRKGSGARAYFDLMRPLNCVMSGIAAVLAVFIALGGDVELFLSSTLPVIQAFIVALLFAFAGNALNDYFDRELDRTAHPERPIPRGDLSPRS
ncbi:MAG: UbiA family prenyltransferase, partial [Thermoplasmata archaeon]|nr:UbiA family prenyltransferase [Thermoplasmata archaeon]